MRLIPLAFIGSALISSNAAAIDDAAISKLESGITRDAAIALAGKPDLEVCGAILGVKHCGLAWSPSLFHSKCVVARFVWGRLYSVETFDGIKQCSPAYLLNMSNK